MQYSKNKLDNKTTCAVSTVRYDDGINNIDDCFSKFINADMIEMIVLRSNIKINSYLENHSDKVGRHKYPFLRITDSVEIRALIGLIIFRGLLGLHNSGVARGWQMGAMPPLLIYDAPL